jgi:hypothetical protein
VQAVLRAREVVASYYDGWLEADDELAACDANNNSTGAPGQMQGKAAFASLLLLCVQVLREWCSLL